MHILKSNSLKKVQRCHRLLLKNGEKFQPTTGVKFLTNNITAKGAISTSHPNYESDMKKVREVQDRVEDLVSSYKEKIWRERQVSQILDSSYTHSRSVSKKTH